MNQADKAIIRLLRNEVVAAGNNGTIRSLLMRLIRIVEVGAHISPDGGPLEIPCVVTTDVQA